jgi:hypothetical protein
LRDSIRPAVVHCGVGRVAASIGQEKKKHGNIPQVEFNMHQIINAAADQFDETLAAMAYRCL